MHGSEISLLDVEVGDYLGRPKFWEAEGSIRVVC
jgi:hypothetical protein